MPNAKRPGLLPYPALVPSLSAALIFATALLASGCATPGPDQARADAVAVLQLSRAEDRFNLAMREFAQRQIERNPELKPYYGAIDNFWRDQVRWPEVRERVVADYVTMYKPEELRGIRRTLESPMGDRVVGHADVLNRELAEQALAAVGDKLPALEQHLKAMRSAAATGQDGGLSPEQDFAAAKTRAEAGDAASQLLVAEKLLAGSGAARDIPQAIQWLEKSAAQDHSPAQDTLASFYYRGVGVTRDYAKASALLEKAASRKYLPAINNFAWLLATCPDPKLRDGKRAIAILDPVMDQSAQMLDTLAAAHAEAGNFAEAVALERRALAGVGNVQDPRFGTFLDRLQSYAASQPWRDPPSVRIPGNE